MKTPYGLLILCLLMTLNALSQPVTMNQLSAPANLTEFRPTSDRPLRPELYPKILADLLQGDRDRQLLGLSNKELALMRFRRSADSSIIAGLRTENGLKDRRIETLIDSSGRGWQMADYWHGRYRNADRERWLYRSGFGLFLILKVK